MIAGSLVAISVVWGFLTWWVFRRFTDHPALRLVRRRLYAHLLEIRLFSEEPALVWRSQKALIVDNLRFLALIARPVLVLSLPFVFLYGQLDSIYGWSPVAVGQSLLVTVQLPREIGPDDAGAVLQVPAGIVVETPPIRDFAERQISWRIRAQRAVRGSLQVSLPGGAPVMRSIHSGEPTLSYSARREPSPMPFFPGPATWVDVDYLQGSISIAWLSLPWLTWFMTISGISAALLATCIRKTATVTRCRASGTGPPTTRPIPSAESRT